MRADDLTSILGPGPTPEELANANRWHAWARERAERDFLIGSVPVDEFPGAERFGRIRQEVDGVVRAPLWQFTAEGEFIEAAAALGVDFPGDAVALTEWVTSPCRMLGGQVPLALILQGQAGVVVRWVLGMRTR